MTPAEMTPTEILMSVMEDFGDSEADRVIIIYTNSNHEVVVKGNGRRCEALGMLEAAKYMLLKKGE